MYDVPDVRMLSGHVPFVYFAGRGCIQPQEAACSHHVIARMGGSVSLLLAFSEVVVHASRLTERRSALSLGDSD